MGVISTVGPFLLPKILPRLRRAYPALKLYLVEALTARLIEGLHAGRLDVVLLALPYDCGNSERRGLFQDPFKVALPRGHPRGREGGRPRTTTVRGIAAPQGGALSARARACGMPVGSKAAVGAGRGYQSAHPGADGGQWVGHHAVAPTCHRRGDSPRNDTHCSTHYRGPAEPGNRPRLARRNRASTRVRAPGIGADATCRGTSS